MNWDDLRYFLAVAEIRTLQGAAQKLGVNHSTVFRRINRFELDVGSRLFERLADGYHLTQAGEELWTHARRAEDEIELFQLKVLGKDYRPSGKIRLTAPENIAYEFLPRYLVSFARRYPEIELEMDVGASSLDLTRREADVALRATTNPPPHLIGRKVVSIDWAYYCARLYFKQNTQLATNNPERLDGVTLIGADGPLARIPAFRHLHQQRINQITMRCSTLNAMSSMAVAGYGVALLPDDQNKSSLVRLFPCEPRFQTELWLLTHPELRRTERIRLLMNHLHSSLRADTRLRGGRTVEA